jgi:hypothetical protein
MTEEYVERVYLPGAQRAARLNAAGAAAARSLAHEMARLKSNWSDVSVSVPERIVTSKTAPELVIDVELGALEVGDVRVQAWISVPEGDDVALDGRFSGRPGSPAQFTVAVPRALAKVEGLGLAARVMPSTQVLGGEVVPGLISWSS